MNQFKAFILKEVFHILRDKRTLLVLIGMPVVQIILFGFALSNEVKNTRIAVLDQSKDWMSEEIISRIHASAYFEVESLLESHHEIDRELRSGNSHMVMVFPPRMADSYLRKSDPVIQFVLDGTNPNIAITLVNYASQIVNDYQFSLENLNSIPYNIEVDQRMLYNPQLKGEFTFVPGVIALVLMLICTMMTAVSIVKEKEMGNMEILLVSPVHTLSIIISKAIPYLVLSLLILTIILILNIFLLQVPIMGSLLLLYTISIIFIFTSLALGLLISTIAKTQQVAMMISLVGLLLPTMLLSGFMFPIESMPWILQFISNLVPAKWFFYSLQAIMIKGLGISMIFKEVLILIAFAIFFIVLSLKKFNIRLA